MMSSIIQGHFLKIKIQLSKSGQEKKRQRIYDLLNAENKSKFLCLPYALSSKENKITEKVLLKKKGEWRILTKNVKKVFPLLLTIKKHANELKVHEKTVRIAIKQDLRPDLNPLDDALWSVLENKTKATSHPNTGSLKTAIEEEWNKTSEEFILKSCKWFRRCVDKIIKKMVDILNKFTVLCLSSYFVVFFFN